MSDFNNTTPEMYDEEINMEETEAQMTQEEILMSEGDLLAGLLDLGKSKDESLNYKKISIKRDGVLKLEFRVRPLTEDESQTCLRRAHKYAPTKPGQTKRIIETDSAKYRSYLILTATIDEDRKKVWDNKAAQTQLGVLQSVDMIDRVLLAGEKNRILEVIDEISGFNDETDITGETAKN